MESNSCVGVVLAAGLGTRLRPSTEKRPKPLIPVGGVEPLFFALYQFQQLGISRVLVNAHHLPEKVAAALKHWQCLLPTLELKLVVEKDEILGTGGALIHMAKEFPDWFSGSEGMLVQNGDTFAQIDISRILSPKLENSFAVSFWTEHLAKYRPLWLDKNKVWAGIGKTSPGENLRAGHFLGVHYLNPSSVARLQSDDFPVRQTDLFNGIYRPLVNEGQVFRSQEYFSSSKSSGQEFWFDMTTQAFLLEAQKHVLTSLSQSSVWPEILRARYPRIRELERGVWVCSEFDQKDVRFESPAIMIDTRERGSPTCLGKLTVGPNASLIHEDGPLEIDPRSEGHCITNSVVFVEKADTLKLPKLIKDEIHIF